MHIVEYTFVPISPGQKIKSWKRFYKWKAQAIVVAFLDNGSSTLSGVLYAKVK